MNNLFNLFQQVGKPKFASPPAMPATSDVVRTIIEPQHQLTAREVFTPAHSKPKVSLHITKTSQALNKNVEPHTKVQESMVWYWFQLSGEQFTGVIRIYTKMLLQHSQEDRYHWL